MVIDFHTHIFPERIANKAISELEIKGSMKASFDGTYLGLLKDMQRNGIDYSITLPVITNPKNTISINNESIRINTLTKENNIIAFGGMHPDYDNYKEEIKRLSEANIKGIKLHPVYQNCNIDDIRYINIINEAFKYDMIVVVHAGLDPGFPNDMHSSINNVISLLKKINKGKIVLAHLGALYEWDKVNELLAGKFDCYLDLAMTIGQVSNLDGTYSDLIKDNLLIDIINKHGSDKILFASDNPWMNTKDMKYEFDKLNLSNDDKDKILYKNAYRILNL